MGCDIHPYPEKLVDGKWITAEPFVISTYWSEMIIDEDSLGSDTLADECERMTEEEILAKYGDDPRLCYDGPWDNIYELRRRNYPWFSILAGVRSDEEIATIAADRGLPDDISMEVRRQSDFDGVDGHSHSWVTLRELLDYDWDKRYFWFTATLAKEQFLRFKTKKIGDYVASIWDIDNLIEVSNDQMGKICLGIYEGLDETKKYYTDVEWSETYRNVMGVGYLQNILDKLAEYGEPEEVRLVFWFDN